MVTSVHFNTERKALKVKSELKKGGRASHYYEVWNMDGSRTYILYYTMKGEER